jgi:hypothetical protein
VVGISYQGCARVWSRGASVESYRGRVRGGSVLNAPAPRQDVFDQAKWFLSPRTKADGLLLSRPVFQLGDALP